MALIVLLGSSCKKSEVHRAGDLTVELSSVSGSLKNVNVYVLSESGNLLTHKYVENPTSAIVLEGISSGNKYIIGALADCGKREVTGEGASEMMLKGISVYMDSIVVASWREDGMWPMVSEADENGSRLVEVPSTGNDAGKVRLKLKRSGTPLALIIDASALRHISPEVELARLEGPEGKILPFSGNFLKGNGRAWQKLTASEYEKVMTTLVDKRISDQCIFNVTDKLEETEDILTVIMYFHNRLTGVTTAQAFRHPVKDSIPPEFDPDYDVLECTLCLGEENNEVVGVWSISAGRQKNKVQ